MFVLKVVIKELILELINPVIVHVLFRCAILYPIRPWAGEGFLRLLTPRVCSAVMSRGVAEGWTYTGLQAARLSISPIRTATAA